MENTTTSERIPMLDTAALTVSPTQRGGKIDSARLAAPGSADSDPAPSGIGECDVDKYSAPGYSGTGSSSASTTADPTITVDNHSRGRPPSPRHSLSSHNRARGVDKFVDLSSKKLLGEGYFGHCYLSHMDGIEVVIKTPRAERGYDELLQETAVLDRLNRHPCVLDYFGWCDVRLNGLTSVGVVYAYYRGGALASYLRDGRLRWRAGGGLLPGGWRTLCCFARDIAAGVQFLHAEGVLHRDLAARNILLDRVATGEPRAIVGDIGFAKFIESEDEATAKIVSCRWCAPEVLRHGSKEYSVNSDVWSYAIVLWEMLTGGKPPWPSLKQDRITRVEMHGHIMRAKHLEIPRGTPEWMTRLLRKCWRHDHGKRSGINRVLAAINSELRNLRGRTEM